MTTQNAMIHDANSNARMLACLPFVLALLAVGFPLFIAPLDFWDGRILDYALDTQQNDGIESWSLTSGWVIQYYLFLPIQWLQSKAGISGSFLMQLVMLVSVCGILHETIRFARDVLRVPSHWAWIAASAVALFPAWNVLLSSIMFMYVLCSWLVLLAVRLIFGTHLFHGFVGLILLLVSFQLNSNFAFSIALAVVVAASHAVCEGRISRRHLLRCTLIAATSIASYVTLKLTFTPSGLYADYNQIQIGASMAELTRFAIEMLRYFEYPILLALLLTAGHGFALMLALMGVAGRVLSEKDAVPQPFSWRVHAWPLLAALALIAAAAFPYVAVGKAADLRAVIIDWNPRHTFLMAMPVGLFVAAFARLLYDRLGGRARSAYRVIAAGIALVALGLFQQAGFWHKLSRGAYEMGIVSALQAIPTPPAGSLKIIAPQMPEGWIRYYESNWIAAKAYGKEAWLSMLVHTPDVPFYTPDWVGQEDAMTPAYQAQHIMRDFRPECETTIAVEGAPFALRDVIAWSVLGSPLPPHIRVSQSRVECPEYP